MGMTTTFDITVNGRFTRNEIPPRCRNPRPVSHDTTTVVSVPVVNPADAPVAITDLRSSDFHVDYRLFDGDLYEVSRLNHGDRRVIVAGSADYPAEVNERTTWGLGTGSSAQEFDALTAKRFRHHIVINGEVWKRADEPRYVVQTFGMGHNHGGTGLFGAEYDKASIAASCYFRLDQFEDAKAYALRVAEDRGDDRSAANIRTMEPMFVVHLPEALRLVVPPKETDEVRSARRDLVDAARAYKDVLTDGDDAAETKAFRALTAARKRLAALSDHLTWAAAERRPYEDGRSDIWD